MNKKELQRTLERSNGLPVIGHACWWSVADTEIGYAQFIQAWTEVGLDPNWAPKPKDPLQAFAVACHRLQNSPIMVRRASDNEFALVLERKERQDDGRTKIRYEIQRYIMLDLKTDRIYLLDENSNNVNDPELQAKIEQLYNVARTTISSHDIRTAILQILVYRLYAMGLRPNGGIYFVPQQHENVIRQIKEFVESKLHNSYFVMIGIVNDNETQSNMIPVVVDNLKAELDVLEQELTEAITEGRQLRSDAKANRMAQFSNIITKAEMYSQLLNMYSEELEDKISAVAGKLLNVAGLGEISKVVQ